jgi:hypothetical protein
MRNPLLMIVAALALLLSAAGASYAQATGEGETGGTTGQATTTPEAKTDNAAGTAGPASGDHGCTADQRWDATQNQCVAK